MTYTLRQLDGCYTMIESIVIELSALRQVHTCDAELAKVGVRKIRENRPHINRQTLCSPTYETPGTAFT